MTLYYLYKKTHKITNLKYLGFTKKDPCKYKGSGIRWLAHLKKHGYDIETEILYETTDRNKIQQVGEYYSKLWNVVYDNEWANLKTESGEGGGVPGMNKGKPRPEEHKVAMKAGWKRIKQEGYRPWNKGITGLKGPCQPIILISPNGVPHQYESMKQGCRENNLIYTKMSNVKNGHLLHHRGWTVLHRTEFQETLTGELKLPEN
jgi:hypothetical protein